MTEKKIPVLVDTDNMCIWGDKEGVFVNVINYNTTTFFGVEAFKEFATAIAKAKREL